LWRTPKHYLWQGDPSATESPARLGGCDLWRRRGAAARLHHRGEVPMSADPADLRVNGSAARSGPLNMTFSARA
jgi:hypothetical protein